MTTIEQRKNRAVVLGIMLGVILLGAMFWPGCSKGPTAPSTVVAAPAPSASTATATAAAPAAPAPIAAEPGPITAPVPTPTPIAADPPKPTLPPAKPFDRGQCNFNSPLSNTTCYNPSDSSITLTGATGKLGEKGCNVNYAGTQTVVIPARTMGHFTLPGPGCDEKFQLDFFFGSVANNCLNPDFTAERSYDGPQCAPKEPPKEPPTVCKEPDWGPWQDVVNYSPSDFTEQTVPVCVPKKKEQLQERFRTGCDGKRQRETQIVVIVIPCPQG